MPLWINYALATILVGIGGQNLIDTIIRYEILPRNHLVISGLRILRPYCMTIFLLFSVITRSFPSLSKRIVGKDIRTGKVAWWSFLIFWPFHLVNNIYSLFIHVYRYYVKGIDVMSQIYHGSHHHATEIFQGGMFSVWKEPVVFRNESLKEWDVVLDLTCETMEMATVRPENYYCVAVFDGTPIPSDDLEQAVEFVMNKTNKLTEKKRILIHCAHGIGRSTMTTLAILLRAGIVDDVNKGFSLIKQSRSIVHLNWRMRDELQRWVRRYPSIATTSSTTNNNNNKS
jgi:protein-tyrosine phosphatase